MSRASSASQPYALPEVRSEDRQSSVTGRAESCVPRCQLSCFSISVTDRTYITRLPRSSRCGTGSRWSFRKNVEDLEDRGRSNAIDRSMTDGRLLRRKSGERGRRRRLVFAAFSARGAEEVAAAESTWTGTWHTALLARRSRFIRHRGRRRRLAWPLRAMAFRAASARSCGCAALVQLLGARGSGSADLLGASQLAREVRALVRGAIVRTTTTSSQVCCIVGVALL